MDQLVPLKKKYGESNEIECSYHPDQTIIKTKTSSAVWIGIFFGGVVALLGLAASDDARGILYSLLYGIAPVIGLIMLGNSSQIVFSNLENSLTIEKTFLWGLWKSNTAVYNLKEVTFTTERYKPRKGSPSYSLIVQQGHDSRSLISIAIKEHLDIIVKRLKSYVKEFNTIEEISKY
jgi:hypothetical protein